MREYSIGGIPVIDAEHKLKGIITNRDLRFQKDITVPVSEVMTKTNLITAPEGTDTYRSSQYIASQ
jgi:IMP dehydrogenase